MILISPGKAQLCRENFIAANPILSGYSTNLMDRHLL